MRITDPVPASSERRVRVLELAMATPGILLITIAIVVLVGAAIGRDLVWPTETLTLPEAAALRDDAEILLLIGRGADPNQAGVIRAGFLTRDPIVLTPLEAAVGAKREETVELLLRNGAVMDAVTWTRLMCFADSLEAPEVRAVLERWRPAPKAALDCTGVDTPW